MTTFSTDARLISDIGRLVEPTNGRRSCSIGTMEKKPRPGPKPSNDRLKDGTVLPPEAARALGKYRARYAVWRAIKRGEMRRGRWCKSCKAKGVRLEGHHYAGYEVENWLKVWWLCRDCHEDIHHPKRVWDRIRQRPSPLTTALERMGLGASYRVARPSAVSSKRGMGRATTNLYNRGDGNA